MLKYNLDIITAVTRTISDSTRLSVLLSLEPWFNYKWRRVGDCEKQLTIGAAWNRCVYQIDNPDTYMCLLDDDNEIHPDFGRILHTAISEDKTDSQVYLCRQYNADGTKRHTWQPEMKWGRIDAAQIVCRAHIAFQVPFQDTNAGPDGLWAEDIVKAGFRWKQTEVPTWYNKGR